MDDKTTLPNEESEYKFNESEIGSLGGSDATTEQSEPGDLDSEELLEMPTGGGAKRIHWKKLIRPGLIVLAILIVYAGFSFHSSKKADSLEQKKLSAQDNASFVQKQSVMDKVASFKTKPAPGISKEQLFQVQDDVQKKVDTVMQQVINDQERISNLNNVLVNTQKDLSSIALHMEQLTTTMQQVLSEVEKLKAAKMKPKKVIRPPVAYHIRAIVPGRVWLESANGKNVTLRVGDNLDGYGVVRIISPKQGLVLMSNGSMIQYGVNDF